MSDISSDPALPIGEEAWHAHDGLGLHPASERHISSDPVDECEIGRRIMDPKDGLLLAAVLLYMGGVWKSGRNARPIADGLRDGIRRALVESETSDSHE